MPASIYFRKVGSMQFIAEGVEAEEFNEKIKIGDVIKGVFTFPRNYRFHKKFMLLVKFAFEHWEPGELLYKGAEVEKDFDRFRKDLTILCGFYQAVYCIDGSVKLKAKSIAFANMDESTFDKLYTKATNVIQKHILQHYTRDDLENVLAQLWEF